MAAPKGKSLCPWLLAQPCVCRGLGEGAEGLNGCPAGKVPVWRGPPAAPARLGKPRANVATPAPPRVFAPVAVRRLWILLD
jgi:hypothetical protein